MSTDGQGGIPLAAQHRLDELNKGVVPFSSTLSVGEFALADKLGVKPIGQVLGASVHQVGYQYLPWESTTWGAGQVMCELEVISQAWEGARRLAFDRLSDEALRVGADAVIGVTMRQGTHDWAEGAVDYVLNGTAIRLPGVSHAQLPALSDLSGQEYWKLYQAGYEPAGLIGATSAFFVSPSSGLQMQRFLTAYQNQELTDFTQGFYAARETVLRRISDQAESNRANGIVGLRMSQDAAIHTFKMGGAWSNQDRHGLVITMHAMGTAIRLQESVTQYPPEPALDLSRQRSIQI